MREFTTPSFPVYMYDGQGNYTVKTMGEVCYSSSFPLYTITYLTHYDHSCCRILSAQRTCPNELDMSINQLKTSKEKQIAPSMPN